MKKIKFKKILELIKPINKVLNYDDLMIEYLSDDINKIRNNSIIFHLNKTDVINEKKFRRLNNCFIVTDQAILKDMIRVDNYLFVRDVGKAYLRVLRYYRRLFKIPIVAVTGTCGKTTTKEMISQVLRNEYKVAATISSKNSLRRINDYLLSIEDDTDFGVFETAITHPGHLQHECMIFKPTIGIITTIGIDHLNHCKTLDNYIRVKSEMVLGLKKNGVLIINNDDENIDKIDLSIFKGRIIRFGINKQTDYYATDITYLENQTRFKLINNETSYFVTIRGLGIHNVYNALSALAALDNLGIPTTKSIAYLSSYRPISGHTELKKGINDSIIIDDTWSSNPTSMEAALKVLEEKGKGKVKIAVIGKINYLGRSKIKSYQNIAIKIKKHKVDILITQDSDSKIIAAYAKKLGMPGENVKSFDDHRALTNFLKTILNRDTICLFKSSMLDKSSQAIIKEIVREI